MTDIQCEENRDCFLVASKRNVPTDLIHFKDDGPKEINNDVLSKQSNLARPKKSVTKKKIVTKAIKRRPKLRRLIPKKVARRKGRKSVVKPKSKKTKRKPRR